MRNHIKKVLTMLLFSLLLLNFLSGCEKSSAHELIAPPQNNSPVSSKRTGIYHQSILALENGFECTSDGAYFMCMLSDGFWLLYSEHGSDSVIKLCGRPDCQHNNSDCNAFFTTGVNICYYNGYLYTYGSDSSGSEGLIRLNLDGSNRVMLFDLTAFRKENGYTGFQSVTIRNGIFSADLRKLDHQGKEIVDTYYYMLDGSMDKPSKTYVIPTPSDGDSFCGIIGYDEKTQQYIFGKWDPITNTTTELARDKTNYSSGYISNNAIYYIDDGVIYEFLFDTQEKSPLFDTELRGSYQLSCFADTIIVSNYIPWSEHIAGKKLENLNMYFYDWNFRNLGSVHIDYPFEPGFTGNLICGETEDRFMLTDSYSYLPRYYINKSELGTGKITIHEYKLPDFE